MEKIPREVSFDIFVKLSLKDLLQCRYVSKQWLSIISDPQFVYYHLHNIEKTNNHKLRIAIHKGIGNKFSVRLVRYGSHDCKNISLPFLDEEKNNKPIEILSSCNGLLLVGTGERDHYLWNPSTGSYKQIVPSNFLHCRSTDANGTCIIRLYGLGYDLVTEAYKVIRIFQVTDTKRNYKITSVRVYNCKTDCWKTIRDSFPYKLVMNGQGTISNGAPHWIVARKDDKRQYVIVYFDLAENVFKEVKTVLPTWLVKGVEFRFGVLEESLCLVYNNQFDAEVWVMKDNNMSWTRLVKIILNRDGFGIRHKVFDDIMKEFIPFCSNRKYNQEVRFEIGDGGKRRKIMYSDDSACGYSIEMTTKVSVSRNDYRRNDDDKEDEILAFDGPMTDTVFDAATCVTTLVSTN